MTSSGRWFRVNTTWSQSDWLAELSPGGRLAWIELLSHVKAHGYDGRLRGVTRYTVSRLYNIPIEDVSALFDAAERHGAMVIEGGEVCITKWGEYQGDPTGAQRVRKHREEKKDVTPVTRNHRVVTPTKTETSTKTKKQPPAVSSWTKRAGELWDAQFGGRGNYGRIGKVLKPLVEKLGEKVVLDAWGEYLVGKEPQFANPEDFATKFGLWANGHGGHRNGKRIHMNPSEFRAQMDRDDAP